MTFAPRSAAIGLAGGGLLAGGFVAIVAGTAGWSHLTQQVESNWWLLAPLVAGFAVQLTLMVELRRRHRLAHAAAASVGAGAAVSGVGMVACCAHHIADLAPIAGAVGAASFLTDAQRPLMAVGVGLNAVAVAFAWHQLHRLTMTSPRGA